MNKITETERHVITKLPFDGNLNRYMNHVKDKVTGKEMLVDFVTGEIVSAIID